MRSLPPTIRRQIVIKACQRIITSEPELQDLFTDIDLNAALPDQSIDALRSLADESDDIYLQLQEAGDVEKSLSYFTKARLLTAVVKAFEDPTLEGAADAIYELCKAQNDPSDLVAFVESEIEAASGCVDQMVETWVTELSGYDFVRSDDSGVYSRTDQSVTVYLWEIGSRRDRNQIAIKMGIWIVDPFLDPVDQQEKIAIAGYLTNQGIDFSETARATWWKEGDDRIALNALLNRGIPELLQFVQIQNLIRHFEVCLAHGVSNDPAKKEWTASIPERLVSGPNRFAKTNVRFPPVYNYYLSLLYYHHQGMMEKSCEFASEWLNHVSSSPTTYEPERTIRQLDIMRPKP